MAHPQTPPPTLPGVTGGESVSPTQVAHGLGRKAEFLALLQQLALEQGIEDYALFALMRHAESGNDDSSSNRIGIPLQSLLLAQAEKTLASYYSTHDPAQREAQELADKTVKDTLKELVAPEAILFIPPDEFAKIHRELQTLAHSMIHDMQALAGKQSKKLPLNEETVKRGLRRDSSARKFRDRHNALFHHINSAREAPETGIEPVAAIAGQHGSITAGHGLYRASVPGKHS